MTIGNIKWFMEIMRYKSETEENYIYEKNGIKIHVFEFYNDRDVDLQYLWTITINGVEIDMVQFPLTIDTLMGFHLDNNLY